MRDVSRALGDASMGQGGGQGTGGSTRAFPHPLGMVGCQPKEEGQYKGSASYLCLGVGRWELWVMTYGATSEKEMDQRTPQASLSPPSSPPHTQAEPSHPPGDFS